MKQSAKEIMDTLLKKDKNLKLGNDDEFVYTRIPFNIPNLDKLTGGGIPTKRISLIHGPSNVGKSYLALRLLNTVQKQGGLTAWVDTELSWDREWVAKAGVNPDEVLMVQPENGEHALDKMRDFMREGVDIIVLDSLAGLVPENIEAGDFSYSPIAWQSRFINQSLPKLMNNLRHGSTLVVINQVRDSLSPAQFQPMPGGKGQIYFAHVMLELKKGGWIEEDKTKLKLGFDIDVRLKKTKAGGHNWENVLVPFRVDGGIDIIECNMREAIAQDLIKKNGAWYTYKDNRIQGMNGLRNFFIANPKVYQEMENELPT